jgi:hypothetical protein
VAGADLHDGVGDRGQTAQGGARIHHANLYVVNTGDSASGRKGEGLEMLKTYVFPSVTDDTWRNERIWSGAASGEGIIFLLRNATEVDPGAGDKRLLIEETEFGGVLDVIKRDGNKLSAMLRRAGTEPRSAIWRSRIATRTRCSCARAITTSPSTAISRAASCGQNSRATKRPTGWRTAYSGFLASGQSFCRTAATSAPNRSRTRLPG